MSLNPTPESPVLKEASERRTVLDRLFLSEGAVYGLVLVAGMIVVSRNLTGSSFDAFLTVVTTVFVFYIAHVFAHTLAGLAGPEGEKRQVGQSFRHALRRSSGMLFVAIIPLAMLSLGVTKVIDDDNAVWLALVVDVVLLGVLGWLITAPRTPSFWGRLAGALLTAGLGGILIVLKAFIHH